MRERPRWRKSTQPKVEDNGGTVKARAKVSSARAKARENTARRACTQSMEAMRPNRIHRRVGLRKSGPRRMSTPERFMMKMMR